MRKYLLGAVSFAVLGSSLFAQYTNTNIQPTTSVVPGAPLQAPATLGPVMTSAPYGPAVHQMGQVGQATAGCSSGSCGHGGCCGTNAVCVPECYPKPTITNYYVSRCEPICPCYFHGCFSHCGDCGAGQCEAPHYRTFLYRKPHVCVEPATRCVPQEAPACAPGCAAPYGGEMIPVPTKH